MQALALGYLIIFGSLLGYSTYEWLLHHASSQLAGTYAFVSPLVAVILGWWLLGEQVSGHTLLAAAAISVGVALIMLHPREPPRGQDAVSEALANAAKHARASAMHVELDSPDTVVRLAIRDDGIGGADPPRGPD